jgi:hypothetical protein
MVGRRDHGNPVLNPQGFPDSPARREEVEGRSVENHLGSIWAPVVFSGTRVRRGKILFSMLAIVCSDVSRPYFVSVILTLCTYGCPCSGSASTSSK